MRLVHAVITSPATLRSRCRARQLAAPAGAARRAPAKSSWIQRDSDGLRVLQVPAFAKIPWLVHGFSTSHGGVSELNGKKILNLSFTDWDSRENVLENRRRFQQALGAANLRLVALKQFHSDVIQPFESAPAEPFSGDASLTGTPGLLLAVQTADCVPILLVDPKRRIVAVIHAGWRGALARIAPKAVGLMQMRFGSKPADILAALGPAIGGCCYEVGTEVATEFTSQFTNAVDWFDELRTGDEPNPLEWLNMMPPGHQPPPKNLLLDLRKANRAQLIDAGLLTKNIFVSDLCTACHPELLFSYRKQGPVSGRLLSVVAIRA